MRQTTAGRRRRGVQVLQLLLVLPVFSVALVASVQYVPLLITKSAITHAATVGAREAGKGATAEQVAEAVNKVLESAGLEITSAAGSGTMVVVERGTIDPWGDTDLVTDPPILPPALGVGRVRVTVMVLFSASRTNGSRVISPYNAFGYMLVGNRFQIRAVAKME